MLPSLCLKSDGVFQIWCFPTTCFSYCVSALTIQVCILGPTFSKMCFRSDTFPVQVIGLTNTRWYAGVKLMASRCTNTLCQNLCSWFGKIKKTTLQGWKKSIQVIVTVCYKIASVDTHMHQMLLPTATVQSDRVQMCTWGSKRWLEIQFRKRLAILVMIVIAKTVCLQFSLLCQQPGPLTQWKYLTWKMI